MDATPRDRVATPVEFARLIDALNLEQALPFALAGYGTARAQEIRTLDWRHVDLALGAMELAADEEGRKPGGSWRVVPLVKPLRTMLRRAWISQGKPSQGKVCPPLNKSKTRLISLNHLQEKARRIWGERAVQPIGLHEARHTAATWLDHAGVSPKVASQLMGHKTPDYQAGAAPITLPPIHAYAAGRDRAGPRPAGRVPGDPGVGTLRPVRRFHSLSCSPSAPDPPICRVFSESRAVFRKTVERFRAFRGVRIPPPPPLKPDSAL